MEFHKDFADRVARHKHVALAAGALVLVSAGGVEGLRRYLKTQSGETISDVSYEDSIRMLASPGLGRRQRPLAETAVLVAANGGMNRAALLDLINVSLDDFQSVTADLRGWGFIIGGRRKDNNKSGYAGMAHAYLPTERLMEMLSPNEIAARSELGFLQEAAYRHNIDLSLVHDAYQVATATDNS
jgi:hypothetical protein